MMPLIHCPAYIALYGVLYLNFCGVSIASVTAQSRQTSGSSTPDIASLVSAIQQIIPSAPLQNKIDVHHHYLPDFYVQLYNAGSLSKLLPLPTWSPDASLTAMKALGVKSAILSLSAPGVCLNGTSTDAARALARKVNEYGAKLRDDHPGNFGFYATLPSLFDVPGVLAEFAYVMDTLHADGVTLNTHYDDDKGTPTYLGDARFLPIWDALNSRGSVAFIQPAYSYEAPPYLPVRLKVSLEYTHDTTRTAVHIILNNVKRNYSNVKVILAHAGGTLPFIIPRIAYVIPSRPDPSLPNKTTEEIFQDYRSFYFDTANAGTATTTQLLLTDVGSDKILVGTDYPYGGTKPMAQFAAALEGVPMSAADRNKVYYENAMKLFPKLAVPYK